MNDHEQSSEQFREAQFRPEIVDEQIDKLMWSHRQRKAAMAPDEQLIGDLQALYGAHAGTRERVWQRLAERIASNDAPTPPLRAEHEESARERIRSFERHHTMKHEILTPQRTQRLSLIAAVVFTALIVGSMAWIFTLARHHNSGSGQASSGVAKQSQTMSQQNQPSYTGIYVNSGKGLMRVNQQTGSVIWYYDLPNIPTADQKNVNAVSVVKSVYVGDTVYALIASSSSQYKTAVIALSAETGKQFWSQPLTGKDLSLMDMIVADDMIYISAQSGQGNASTDSVYSFAARDGKQGTTYSVPAYVFAITVLKGALYVAAQDGLYAFDLASHQQRWHTALKTETPQQTLVVTRPHIVNGILYAAVVSDNEAGPTVSRLAAFSTDSGKQVWQSDLIQGQVFDLTISNGVIYAGSIVGGAGNTFKGTLGAYDAQKGKQLWSQPTDGGIQWAPSVSNGVVYASAYVDFKQPENVLAVRASDGKQLWQYHTMAGLMTTPYEQNGIVYVAGGFNNGKLYALKAGKGAAVWTLNLNGEPQDITVVP
jgi:outer membrane protein assembly factor BamB